MGIGWFSTLWILTGIQFGLAFDDASPVSLNRETSGDEASIGAANLTHQAIPAAQQFDSVWVRVLRDVNTECKTCPYPNCPNKNWYGSSYQFSAKCWTVGAIIGRTKYADIIYCND
jgi:hypothetical protein